MKTQRLMTISVGLILVMLFFTQAKADDEAPVVEANTIAAAEAEAVEQNKQALAAGAELGESVRIIVTKEGNGIIATGMASYETYPNPNASLISKRRAYIAAYHHAKMQMAEFLNGTDNDANDQLVEKYLAVDTATASVQGSQTESSETIKQTAEGFLRGFVVCEVDDDEEGKMITVSIASTPKTRGELQRGADGQILVNDLKLGLARIEEEIRYGIVPPMGGRVVFVEETGEFVFIGFGSALIRPSSNAALAARNKLTASRIAGVRAKDALCAVINGDTIESTREVVSDVKELFLSVEDYGADPLDAKPELSEFADAQKSLGAVISQEAFKQVIQSSRKGILPPGTQPKSWIDDDGVWAYSMVIYSPAKTNLARDINRSMREAEIVKPVSSKVSPKAEATSPATVSPSTKTPAATIPRGPSGRVTAEEDL